MNAKEYLWSLTDPAYREWAKPRNKRWSFAQLVSSRPTRERAALVLTSFKRSVTQGGYGSLLQSANHFGHFVEDINVMVGEGRLAEHAEVLREFVEIGRRAHLLIVKARSITWEPTADTMWLEIAQAFRYRVAEPFVGLDEEALIEAWAAYIRMIDPMSDD